MPYFGWLVRLGCSFCGGDIEGRELSSLEERGFNILEVGEWHMIMRPGVDKKICDNEGRGSRRWIMFWWAPYGYWTEVWLWFPFAFLHAAALKYPFAALLFQVLKIPYSSSCFTLTPNRLYSSTLAGFSMISLGCSCFPYDLSLRWYWTLHWIVTSQQNQRMTRRAVGISSSNLNGMWVLEIQPNSTWNSKPSAKNHVRWISILRNELAGVFFGHIPI